MSFVPFLGHCPPLTDIFLVWTVIAEAEEKQRQAKRDDEEKARLSITAEVEKRRQEIKNST
jgi:hypothetical protein